MSEYLAAAAEKMGMPEALVLRSAGAKAKAQGVTVEDLLREWAGGEAATATTPASPPAPAADTAPAPAAPPSAPDAAPTPIAEGPVEVVYETLPTPATVTPEEAMGWDQVTTIASDDVRERPGSVIPRWLAAAFVIIPVLALSYLIVNTDGLECGTSGLLASDFEGNLANCDLTAYVPGGSSGDAVVAAAFASGQGLYSQCSSCHGASGEGGVGPAFGDVTATFAACSDHIEWVTLGSAGWPNATYGDNGKAVTAGMPGFGASLSESELVAISLYERVQFGGETLEDAGLNCGLVEPEGEPVEGEAPAEDA
jgi:mono/diheme cytochrome c family protein